MRFTVLILACLSGPSIAADWHTVSRENRNGTSFYIDLDSIDDDGRFARAWTLENRRTPKSVTMNRKSFSYQSYISLKVFDCNKRRSATVQGTFYSLPHGKGDALHSFSGDLNNKLFSEVTPASMGEALLEYACDSPAQRKIQT